MKIAWSAEPPRTGDPRKPSSGRCLQETLAAEPERDLTGRIDDDWWERAARLREEIRQKHGILPDSAGDLRKMRDVRTRWLEEMHCPNKSRVD